MRLKTIRTTGRFKFSLLFFFFFPVLLFAAVPLKNDPDLLYRQGQRARKENRIDEAKQIWEQLLQTQPHHYPTLLGLTELYSFTGNFEQTLHYGIEALKIAPNNPDLLYLLGTTYSYTGKSDEAVDLLEKGFKLDPQRIDFLFHLSEIERLQHHYPAAEKWAEKILTLQPKNPKAAYQLGFIAASREDRPQARKWFEQAVVWDPDFTPALFSLALFAIEKKQFETAKQLLTQIIKIDGVHPRAFFYMGLLAQQAGNDFKEYYWYKRAETYLPKESSEREQVQARCQALEETYQLNEAQMKFVTQHDLPVALGDRKERLVQVLGAPPYENKNGTFLNYPEKFFSIRLEKDRIEEIQIYEGFQGKILGVTPGLPLEKVQQLFDFLQAKGEGVWSLHLKNQVVTYETKEGRITEIILTR